MSNSPVITGIVIFLNGEKFLAEAIESVIAQTFTDWELLLCDDGSTDGATKIAKNYASKYPDRIRYLEHPNHENRGMSATRNLGIRNARGDYIAMLDADDVWTPVKLEEQLAILKAHPEVAMVYGPMKLWSSWKDQSANSDQDQIQNMGVPADSIASPPQLLLSFLRNPTCHVCGLLTRKDVLLSVGCYEEEFRTEYEDVIVQSKISLRYPVYASNKCWYWYRQHDDSCTAITRRQWQQKPARLKYLNKLEAHLRSNQITSGPVWDEVQRQLRPFRNRFRYELELLLVRIALAGRWIAKKFFPRRL
ncbi:MAG TPA: glycosyltransferase family 2 protein, partial [Tepidisphaeraceae bacterium]|nr:glycosyltransferase family 2 protein [Tepidisphaeraceae bacterium]